MICLLSAPRILIRFGDRIIVQDFHLRDLAEETIIIRFQSAYRLRIERIISIQILHAPYVMTGKIGS